MSVRRMFRAASLLPGWIACAASSAAPTTFTDCRDCPPMVIIPGGTFTMGSPPTEPERRRFEGPQPGVTVATFAIGETEVTRAQYAVFVKDTKRTGTDGCFTYGFSGFRDDTAVDMKASWRNPGFEQTPEHPVVCISWEDARDYTAWLARKTGHPYRLPSEAEWDYAARGHDDNIFLGQRRRARLRLHEWRRSDSTARASATARRDRVFAARRGRGRAVRQVQRRQCIHVAGASLSTQCVRSIRHHRQCLGIRRGLLARIAADQRARARRWPVRVPPQQGRLVGRLPGGTAIRSAQSRQAQHSRQLRRISRRAHALDG
jgi:hypothetical protein